MYVDYDTERIFIGSYYIDFLHSGAGINVDLTNGLAIVRDGIRPGGDGMIGTLREAGIVP